MSSEKKNTTNKLSIIVPVLNEAETIVSMLTKLQALRSEQHEIILVDGGSHDDTVQLTGDLADHVLHSEPGRARQMNRGASAAEGNIFWFLHADSLPDITLAQQIFSAAETLTGPDFWGRFDIQLSGCHWLLRWVEYLMNRRSNLTGIATGDQGLFISRHLFEQLLGFPEQPLMEDIAWCKRAKKICAPLSLPGPLVSSSRRWEEEGILQTIWLMWRLRLAYFMGFSPEKLANHYYPTSKGR